MGAGSEAYSGLVQPLSLPMWLKWSFPTPTHFFYCFLCLNYNIMHPCCKKSSNNTELYTIETDGCSCLTRTPRSRVTTVECGVSTVSPPSLWCTYNMYVLGIIIHYKVLTMGWAWCSKSLEESIELLGAGRIVAPILRMRRLRPGDFFFFLSSLSNITQLISESRDLNSPRVCVHNTPCMCVYP